ncbi:MAG: DUF4252 domain-containing protein [Chitinophagales bacterium]
MKKIFAILILSVFSATVFAADLPQDDEEEGTRLNLWIPGFLVKLAGSIVEDHESEAQGDFIKKFGSMTICVREGSKYSERTDKKMTRKINRLDRKNYESLLKVNDAEAKVDLRIKENKKGFIKRLVIIADEPGETYVYLNIHCKLKPGDISTFVNNMGEMDFQ